MGALTHGDSGAVTRSRYFGTTPGVYFPAMWGPLYASRFANLGNTTTIVPLVDLPNTAITSTTFTTRVFNASGSSQTATWSTAPSGLASPFVSVPVTAQNGPGLLMPSGIPVLKFNGTSEKVSIPDANYWTRALAAFSVIGCIYSTSASGAQMIFSKSDNSTQAEWDFYLNSGKLQLQLFDSGTTNTISRQSDAAVTLNTPLHVCITMDNGADCTNAVVYINGASVASSALTSGTFTTMVNGTAAPTVGADTSGNFFVGSIYGGPFGPAFVQAQLTAAQVLNDYNLFRAAIGV